MTAPMERYRAQPLPRRSLAFWFSWAGSLALVGLLFILLIGTPPALPSAEAAPAPQPVSCLSELPPDTTFDEPGKESVHAHGPVPTSTQLDDLLTTLQTDLCGTPERGADKGRYTSIQAAIDGSNPNREISREEWQAGVDYMVGSGLQWDEARVEQNLPAADPARGVFRTTYMEAGEDPQNPRIGVTDVTRGGPYLVMPFVTPDGKILELWLRIDCRFQPVNAAIAFTGALDQPGRTLAK